MSELLLNERLNLTRQGFGQASDLELLAEMNRTRDELFSQTLTGDDRNALNDHFKATIDERQRRVKESQKAAGYDPVLSELAPSEQAYLSDLKERNLDVKELDGEINKMRDMVFRAPNEQQHKPEIIALMGRLKTAQLYQARQREQAEKDKPLELNGHYTKAPSKSYYTTSNPAYIASQE